MPRKKAGAPTFKPTDRDRELVKILTAGGVPQERIAMGMGEKGIDPKTLRKHFRQELDQSSVFADAICIGELQKKIRSGDTTAMIWWTKTRMGWKETNVNEHAGAVTLRTIYENEPKK